MKPKLTPTQRKAIAEAYKSRKYKIKELAQMNNVHPRTIGRVLEEFELLAPKERLQGDAYVVAKILEEFKVSPDRLRVILTDYQKVPLLTPENIQKYLNNISNQQMARHLTLRQAHLHRMVMGAEKPVTEALQNPTKPVYKLGGLGPYAKKYAV